LSTHDIFLMNQQIPSTSLTNSTDDGNENVSRDESLKLNNSTSDTNNEVTGKKKVKELVERFEKWEKNEKKKDISSNQRSMSMLRFDVPSNSQEDAPPVTPRGQVRRLRDMLEAKTKVQSSSTVIPAKKNENLKRLKTSYYERTKHESDDQPEIGIEIEVDEEQVTNAEGDVEPYVHVDAYWDNATQAYWYQNEDSQWLVYDEKTQMFVDPVESTSAINLPESVAASMNRLQRSSMSSSSSSPSSGMKDTASSPLPSVNSTGRNQFSGGLSSYGTKTKIESSGFRESDNRTDKERESEIGEKTTDRGDDRICAASISMLNLALQEISTRVDVGVSILRKFHLGVQLYALVKSNGGMLKPIILHLAVDRGKIYIVRQGRSRFLTIRHFSECDYSTSCIDFMAKDNSKTSSAMRQTIQGLRQQPLVVLWTSDHFVKKANNTDRSAKDEEAAGASKGMAFVFDNRNLRGEFLLILRAMVKYWLEPKNISFTFKERGDDDAALLQEGGSHPQSQPATTATTDA